MKRNTTVSDIKRDSMEGKLLFAAIIELTTKLHTNKTPDEVIELLWEIWERTDKGNQGTANLKSMSIPEPFTDAIKKRLDMEAQFKQNELSAFTNAGNLLLNQARIYSSPDKGSVLETILVDIYKEMKRE